MCEQQLSDGHSGIFHKNTHNICFQFLNLGLTYDNVEDSNIPEDCSYDHDSEGYVPEALNMMTHVILRVLRTLDDVIMIWSWKVISLLNTLVTRF